jgi:PadR family transcriptional regulator, regulatory protein AphA
MARLTPTSYAILGLLAIQPWSTYELTKLLGRSVQFVMPRTEANRYQEPKRLVEMGLATAELSRIGQRRRTVYEITPAGRDALVAWLQEPARPTQLESEGMLKILFGNMTEKETLIARIQEFGAEAEAMEEPWRAIARDYAEGRGPFPERVHVNMLFWVLLDRWARLRADWARWAAAEVGTWPDARGPADLEAARQTLQQLVVGELHTGLPGQSGSTTRDERPVDPIRGGRKPARAAS